MSKTGTFLKESTTALSFSNQPKYSWVSKLDEATVFALTGAKNAAKINNGHSILEAELKETREVTLIGSSKTEVK